MVKEEKEELDKIFIRASICRAFNLSGLQEVLQRTDFPVTPVELIWQVGDLNAKDYVTLGSDISNYIVNRQKAEPTIQKLEEPSLCRLHDAWHDWFREEFEQHFRVEDLGSLLYHETTYHKRCTERGKNTLKFLKEKVQDYLGKYFRAVAEELEIPSSVSIPDLRQAFATLLSSMKPEHREKQKDVTEYIPRLIQQFQQLYEANMFKNVLSTSEYESFIEFLMSLNPCSKAPIE